MLNLHSHACSLYSAAKVLGIEFTEEGVDLKPALPASPYRFASPLLGLARSATGEYEGWYEPSRAGRWSLRIELPVEDAAHITHAEVNSKVTPLKKLAHGAFELNGGSEPGKPLRWALR